MDAKKSMYVGPQIADENPYFDSQKTKWTPWSLPVDSKFSVKFDQFGKFESLTVPEALAKEKYMINAFKGFAGLLQINFEHFQQFFNSSKPAEQEFQDWQVSSIKNVVSGRGSRNTIPEKRTAITDFKREKNLLNNN